jgi:thymidylate kinase
LIYISKNTKKIKSELLWLKSDNDLPESLSLLNKYCPVIDESLFIKCINTLENEPSLFQRIKLARKVRKRLSIYAKYTYFERLSKYIEVIWIKVHRSFGPRKNNKVLQGGGAVIAFVGPDATGKSTLVSETANWLGDVFSVNIVHAGKPPSSWITAPFNLILRITKGILPKPKPTKVVNNPNSENKQSSQDTTGLIDLFYAIRAVTLAWDRKRLLKKSWRDVAHGEFVICDRYPSTIPGAMDSPRLYEYVDDTGILTTFYNRLANLEKKIYRQIPSPDIVLKLVVSIETAKARDRNRGEQDGDTYLENRHRLASDWYLPGIKSITEINTDQSLDETMLNVKKAIWDAL